MRALQCSIAYANRLNNPDGDGGVSFVESSAREGAIADH
jgi:hypothetical protein